MTEPSDDEVLVTKWLMLGGVIWDGNSLPTDEPNRPYRWYAIERWCDERTGVYNDNGHTPAHAVRRYLERYKNTEGHEWLAPLLEHVRSSTPSCRGPT